ERGTRSAALWREDPRRGAHRPEGRTQRRAGAHRAPPRGSPRARPTCAEPVTPRHTPAQVRIPFQKLMALRALPTVESLRNRPPARHKKTPGRPPHVLPCSPLRFPRADWCTAGRSSRLALVLAAPSRGGTHGEPRAGGRRG